jgi:hypothetical protein
VAALGRFPPEVIANSGIFVQFNLASMETCFWWGGGDISGYLQCTLTGNANKRTLLGSQTERENGNLTANSLLDFPYNFVSWSFI